MGKGLFTKPRHQLQSPVTLFSWEYCLEERFKLSQSAGPPRVILFACAHQQTRRAASQVGHAAGRRETQPARRAPVSRSPGEEAFRDQWKTRMSPNTFFVYVMVKIGEKSQTRRHPDSGLFSQTTLVPHSSSPKECIATLRLGTLGANLLIGNPRRQQIQINLQAHQVP